MERKIQKKNPARSTQEDINGKEDTEEKPGKVNPGRQNMNNKYKER